MTRLLYIILLVTAFILPSQATEIATEISHEKFTLSNGLRVIVHEDRKAPIVSVGVWYHVGSKDEPMGKTGFAHLFEHIMFRGSENFKGSFMDVMREMGASNMNGTTSFDRTNYYATVPSAALERLLWIESDRMGFLLGAVTQKVLDDERKIVQNEKRQHEGQPYGLMNEAVERAIFPASHPYHHTPIGSMDDLNNASLEDVHSWFRKYYGAANAVVVLSGDIDVDTARELMTKYFGDIAAGPPLHRAIANIPYREHNTIDIMYDRVPQSLLSRSWVVPGRTQKEKIMLDVVAGIFNGKMGRLYKKLVEELDIATEASVGLDARELSSLFSITAKLKDGRDMADLERAVDEIMARFLSKGPTKRELSRNREYIDTVVLRELDGIHARGQVLAQGEIYAGDPGFIQKDLDWTRGATAKDVRSAARKWLSGGYHQLTILPYGNPDIVASQIDRSQMPDIEITQSAKLLPEIQQAILPNGLKVILAARYEKPMINMALTFRNAGGIGDEVSRPTASGALYNDMNQTPDGMNKQEFEREKSRLGVRMMIGSGPFNATMNMSSVVKHFPASLTLMADMLLKPTYSEMELAKWKDRALMGLKNAKSNPRAAGSRTMGKLLYGDNHPLSEYPDVAQKIAALTLKDMKAHYGAWIRPDNGVLYVSGDITMDVLLKELIRVFGKWQAPKVPLPVVEPSYDVPKYEKSRVILIDSPAAPQTMIMAGRIFDIPSDETALALDAANAAFGGGMTSRISANLRVEKGWTYGAGSGLSRIPGQTMWQVSAPVQSDRTAESLVEILKEMNDLLAARPIGQDEFDRYRKSVISGLPARFERSEAVLGSMMGNAFLGKPIDDVERLAQRLEKLNRADVQAAAQEYLGSEGLLWVLVGDLSKYENIIREMNIGNVEIWSLSAKKISN